MIDVLKAASVGAVIGVMAVSAAAQDQAFEVTGETGVIEVQAGHAVTVSFADAFSELSIGMPETADISSLSDRMLYLLGKTVGSTTLTVIRGTGRMDATHMTVVVYRDIAPLQAFLKDGAKDMALTRSGVVVTASGCIADDRQRRALDGVVAELKAWGYSTLVNAGPC